MDQQQYLILPSMTPGTNGLTVAFWFKFDNRYLFYGTRFFDFGRGPADNNWFQQENNMFTVYTDGGISRKLDSVTSFSFEVWYHSVWTLSPAPYGNKTSVWSIYINGDLKNTGFGVYPQKVLTSNFIGKSNWDNDPYYNGAIDDFRIYNKVLNKNDVKLLYGESN